MSSEHRAPSQIPVNKLYVNIAAVNSTIFDGTGAAPANIVAWVNNEDVTGLLSTPGSAILRDMGKTVYLPANDSGAIKSTVLRKVQLVTEASVGGDEDNEYLSGYIALGGMTYGGGDGVAARVARLN